MSDPHLIWRFGRWIARREGGAARLSWCDGELVLRLIRNKIIAIEGLDPHHLGGELGCRPAGHDDLLLEAQALAGRLGIPENKVLKVVKQMLAQALRSWLLDGGRQLELVDGDLEAEPGPTISITHALVELVLSDTDERLYESILPDPDVLLRRHASFLELYSPLRLSEDADLIVAKITGQRTAREICLRTPHETPEVVRLLTALVAAGMLEPIPVAPMAEDLELLPRDTAPDEIIRRPLPIGWIIAGAVVLVMLLGVVSLIIGRPESEPAETGEWSLAIDMGCEPQDMQRMLAKQAQSPKHLSVQPITEPSWEKECARLLWTETFTSEEAAKQALSRIPKSLLHEGFPPQPVRVSNSTEEDLE